MAKSRPAFSAERNCLHDGFPVIAVALSGVRVCKSSPGSAWMAFPCAEAGTIQMLADRFRALADEIESMKGQEGGMYSMPEDKQR